MILIADGGATKADWVFLDKKGSEVAYTQSLGINPEVVDRDDIFTRIKDNVELLKHQSSVSSIYFYGAGCGTPRMKIFLGEVFAKIFPKAKNIIVKEDIYAATYATVDSGQKSVVCILGTGSNCNFWDGKEISQKVDSLGYILMDDCSGNHLGKQLIRAYYFGQMPSVLSDKLSIQYNLDPDAIKENIYKQPNPNKYLATFARFLIENKSHSFCRRIIDDSFQLFIDNYILQYKEAKKIPVHFVGSIAYYLADELKFCMSKNGLKVGKIIKKPIDGLVDFYNKYGLS